MNYLYYGDNLDVLRRYIKDESVDLIYLDPPFKSNQSYNILFKERNGTQSSAQIRAFEDTWHWDRTAEDIYMEIVEKLPKKVADLIKTLRSFLGENDMMAYLVMMAIRLQELRRVLKPTGSIYLHCDPTASHYLKLVMDAVFGGKNFINEIIWKRTDAKGNVQKKYGWIHDRLLFYAKTDKRIWNQQYISYDTKYIEQFYNKIDKNGRRYQATDLTAPMIRASKGQIYSWRGYVPPPSRCFVYNKEKMLQLDREGRIEYTKRGCPRLIRYLDKMKGNKCPDIWIDIKIAQKAERLDYPTQKPEALLERIIKASSNEGDVVLDPFCGCGTTITVAGKLKRKWIGIDITHLAISLMRKRLRDSFGDEVEYKVIGEPIDLEGAGELAKQDPYQFQWWALGLVGARPAKSEQKKGPDEGIDGYIYFHDDPKKKETKAVIIQVKGGLHIGSGMIDALKGVVEKENAQIGVFITLKEPTKPMQVGAVSSGYYRSPLGRNYPKMQILTVKELLEGKRIDYPSKVAGVDVTFKRAEKYKERQKEQGEMF